MPEVGFAEDRKAQRMAVDVNLYETSIKLIILVLFFSLALFFFMFVFYALALTGFILSYVFFTEVSESSILALFFPPQKKPEASGSSKFLIEKNKKKKNILPA